MDTFGKVWEIYDFFGGLWEPSQKTQAVGAVVYVRSPDDIRRALAKARSEGRRVAVRGTKHSMGGQSMAADSVVIDMTKMTQMQFDSASGTIVCESGCTWADLILYLTQFGMSPRTMQSYSTFSVGGTLAVNGHGITTDFSLSECALMVLYNLSHRKAYELFS